MDWIQQWQSKLNKQNGVAPLVRTGGSRHTGLAALPYRNIQTPIIKDILYRDYNKYDDFIYDLRQIKLFYAKKNATYSNPI